MRGPALALGALVLLPGCGSAQPADTNRPPPRAVLELPVRDAQELRHHFGREMAVAGYTDDWLLPADEPMLEGYTPRGTPAGWSAVLLDADPLEWGHGGRVGTVRRRLTHPDLAKPALSLSIEVAQYSCLAAHFLLLKVFGQYTSSDSLTKYSGEPIGDAGTVRISRWSGRDADYAISHLSFVRRNVRVLLGWVVARVDRAGDNDTLIIDAARAIDAQLLQRKRVKSLAMSRRRPSIAELAFREAQPVTAAGPGADKYAVTHTLEVTAECPEKTALALSLQIGDPGRRIWRGSWGTIEKLDAPNIYGFAPGARPGPQHLFAIAVNERGLVAVRELTVDVLPFGESDDESAGEDG